MAERDLAGDVRDLERDVDQLFRDLRSMRDQLREARDDVAALRDELHEQIRMVDERITSVHRPALKALTDRYAGGHPE